MGTITTENIETTQRDRRVEHVFDVETREDGSIVQLSVNVSHDTKGTYKISLWRQTRQGLFVKYAIPHDYYLGAEKTIGARYSAKNLDTVSEYFLEWFIDLLNHDPDLIPWAKETKTR